MKKVGKTLLFGLVILAIAAVVYLVVPKYTVTTKSISTYFVQVTKVNNLTGKTDIWLERITPKTN